MFYPLSHQKKKALQIFLKGGEIVKAALLFRPKDVQELTFNLQLTIMLVQCNLPKCNFAR